MVVRRFAEWFSRSNWRTWLTYGLYIDAVDEVRR